MHSCFFVSIRSRSLIMEMIKIGRKGLSDRLLLFFSWMTAIAATCGSLYFSEVRHLIPCTLCWYQRILMYPLTIILGIAYFRKDFLIRKYILPISILGFIIASYHYTIQIFPGLYYVRTCSVGDPCTDQDFSVLGFVTIPFMSGTAFFLITLSMLLMRTSSSEYHPGSSKEKALKEKRSEEKA